MDVIKFKNPDGTWTSIPVVKGTDGRTPVKGVDYFTQADVQEMVQKVLDAMPDGNGVKY